jgi:uncharacterized protein DUF4340
MQQRSFRWLLGATIVLVAAAIFVMARGERGVSPAAEGTRVFPDLAAHLGDLAWVRLSHGAIKADFALISGRWVVVEKGNYPAAPDKIRRLLLGLADLSLVEPKTERPELFARLDLDDPGNGKSTLVALQDRGGKTIAELVVGKTRHDRLGAGNDGVYIRRPGTDRAWLARGSVGQSGDLAGDVAGWLDRRILDIPASRIAGVTLTGDDGARLVLKRDAPDGKFVVADPPADTKFKGDAALAEPAGALAALDLDDVKPAAELPAPASGVATAVFTSFDGLSVTLRLFAHDNADWVTIEAAGNGAAEAEAKAIDARLARWSYAIPASRAKLLRTRLADLVAPPKGS